MKAFTLIELLIVVAIIAILAAIAVPNFLEAQTRAKVARVGSDMRSVATGLESYVVDHNKYPPDATDAGLLGTTRYMQFLHRFEHLTTPIGYMTALPKDFFAEKAAQDPAYCQGFREGATPAGEVLDPIVYDYAKYDRGKESPLAWDEISAKPGCVMWAMASPGPDINDYAYLGDPGLVRYDPTNGTVSIGHIVRTNVSVADDAR